jgi:signal transduction histidine kinase
VNKLFKKKREKMRRNIYLLGLVVIFLGAAYSIESRVRKVQQASELAEQDEGGEQAVADEEKNEPVVIRSGQQATKYDFSIEAKRKQVVNLLEKASNYFSKTSSIEKVFNAFSSSPEFLQGELYVFVYDMDGTCYASGLNQDRIWQNHYQDRDAFGTPYIQMIIETAKKGGGWTTYEWSGAVKVTYTKLQSKDGKDYVIGCGYHPFSKEDAVISLVKAGAAFFNKTVAEGKSKTEALGLFGYPLGRFVSGDLYLYAMTFSGDIVAHGERGGLIGTNGWDYRDSRGKYVNREIAEKLKTATSGIWMDYQSKRAPKRAYAEKVVDNKGVEYFIACGYYPDADKNAVVDLVRKGYVFMKGYGLTEAAREFNDLDHEEFRYGDLYLFVFDLDGNCKAEGSDPQYVGRNMWDDKDEDGRFYVRELVQKAKDGGGWVDYKVKNSFKSTYVELVDLGTGKYVIGSGLYPTTKLETMTLLAKSAADYIRSGQKFKDTIGELTKSRSKFTRGDLSIFVLTQDGICLANGMDYNLIWKNISSWKDASGIPVIKILNDSLDRGPGLVAYTKDNLSEVAYIEEVKKDGTTYIVGSKFFK